MMTQIIISMDEKGAVSVNGPLENKILCYGLLEVAKETVVKFQEQMAKKVIPATVNDIANFKNKEH